MARPGVLNYMNNLHALATWAEPLLQTLTAKERTALLKRLAIALRKRNQQRIQKQRTPQGQPFEPRKNTAARPRALFTQLRKTRHIKTQATPASATLAIIGRAGYIAAIHQHGRVSHIEHKNGPTTQYPKRELLGFSADDLEFIEQFLINALAFPAR